MTSEGSGVPIEATTVPQSSKEETPQKTSISEDADKPNTTPPQATDSLKNIDVNNQKTMESGSEKKAVVEEGGGEEVVEREALDAEGLEGEDVEDEMNVGSAAEFREFDSLIDLPPNVTPSILKKIMTNEVARIKEMSPAEFLVSMANMQTLHDQIYAAAGRFLEETINMIPEITPVLKSVGDYDQITLDKLLAVKTEDYAILGIPEEERENILLDVEERMIESMKVNFDFTHQISYIASPFTVWRLDACKAVWAGHNEIANAKKGGKLLLEDPNALKDKEGEDGGEDGKADGADGEKGELDVDKNIAEEAGKIVEEHVEGELDPQVIAASERPPFKAWPKRVYTLGEGDDKRVICYVRAPPDCLVEDDDLICTFANTVAEWPNLPGNAEVIGKFVCIRPRHPKVVCILPDEPWIIGIPHSYGKNPAKEVVVFWMESGELGPIHTALDTVVTEDSVALDSETQLKPPERIPWNDLQTADVFNEDSRYLEFKISKLPQSVFAPSARIRRDSAEIGRSGGKLTCLIDSRVTITIPQGALRITIPYSMQVQSINQHHAQLLRDQNLNFMSSFIACSPLVMLTGPTKILFKLATFTLPLTDLQPTSQVVFMASAALPVNSSGSKGNTESDDLTTSDEEAKAKKTGPVILDAFQKSLLLPQLLAGASSSHAELALVIAGNEDSNWLPWEAAEIIETKDSDMCIFNVVRIKACKYMAIKTRTVVDTDSLLQMAAVLERSLAQRMVYFILRQNRSDPSQICLAITLTHNVEKALQKLVEEGFTDGDKPTGPLFIYERQVFDLTFKGNLRSKKGLKRDSMHLTEETGPMRIAFNSSLRNRYIICVEECDSGAQVACEKYRGFLEITYQHLVQKIIKKNVRQSVRVPVGPKKFTMEVETAQLCQLLIKLPKKNLDLPKIAELQPYSFLAKDSITDVYIASLSKKLVGDTWRRLGTALSMSRPQLQAVGGRAESSGANKALTMLNTWIKNLPLEADRYTQLLNALQAIGRTDLVAELRQENTQMSTPDRDELTTAPS